LRETFGCIFVTSTPSCTPTKSKSLDVAVSDAESRSDGVIARSLRALTGGHRGLTNQSPLFNSRPLLPAPWGVAFPRQQEGAFFQYALGRRRSRTPLQWPSCDKLTSKPGHIDLSARPR
jgi:hypothetical protein